MLLLSLIKLYWHDFKIKHYFFRHFNLWNAFIRSVFHSVKIFRLGTKKKRSRFCTVHEQCLIEYFCRNDQQAICSRCVIIGEHKLHDIQTLEDKVQIREMLTLSFFMVCYRNKKLLVNKFSSVKMKSNVEVILIYSVVYVLNYIQHFIYLEWLSRSVTINFEKIVTKKKYIYFWNI